MTIHEVSSIQVGGKTFETASTNSGGGLFPFTHSERSHPSPLGCASPQTAGVSSFPFISF